MRRMRKKQAQKEKNANPSSTLRKKQRNASASDMSMQRTIRLVNMVVRFKKICIFLATDLAIKEVKGFNLLFLF